MRREASAFVHLRQPLGHALLNGTDADPLALRAEEHRGAVGLRPEAGAELIARAFVLTERALRMVAHGHDALLATLSPHLDQPGEEVKVLTVDAA